MFQEFKGLLERFGVLRVQMHLPLVFSMFEGLFVGVEF